jgi:hypothetical protein
VLAAFKILASLPSLKKLYIHHDERMLRVPRRTVNERKAAAMRIPDVAALKQILELEEVIFSGNCEIIEAILKPLTEKPVSKKRKRMFAEVEDWKRRKRAVRPKKGQEMS